MMSRLTAVIGLGAKVEDVTIIPPLPQSTDCVHGCQTGSDSGDNIYFRTLQNLTVQPTTGSFVWNTSQMCPLRRLHVLGNLDVGNFVGGFVDLTSVDNDILSTKGGDYGGTQQQEYCFRRVSAKASPAERPGQYGFVYVDCNILAAFPASTTLCMKSPDPIWSPDKSTMGQNISCTSRRSDATSPLLGLADDNKSYTLSIRGAPATPAVYIKDAGELKATKWMPNTCYLLFPNVYYLDGTLNIDVEGVALVGLGFPVLRITPQMPFVPSISISGTNCTLASLIVDAPPASAKQTILIEIQGANAEIYDVTCTTNKLDDTSQVRTDIFLQIESPQCYLENVWLWRADHWYWGGFGDVGQDPNNLCAYGLNVTTTAVETTCVGLFVEHPTATPIVWDGEDGAIYMSQGECAYSSMGTLGPATRLPGHRQGAYLSLGPVKKFQWIGGNVYAIFGQHSDFQKVALELTGTDLSEIVIQNLSIDGWVQGVFDAAVVYQNQCYGPFKNKQPNYGVIICDLKQFLQYTQSPFVTYDCTPPSILYSSIHRAWGSVE